MPIQFDNFDQNKIDRLKNHLTAMAEKGKAKFYEIFVDTLKAVPKTDEVSDFESYEDYMNADTEQIKLIIYNSALSPRNDQFVFLVKARNREEAMNLGLSGMPIKKFSRNNVNEWREENKFKGEQYQENLRLKRELNEYRKELEEKETYIEQLEELIEKAKKNGNKIGGVHIGDVLSVAFEGLVRRNTHLIAKFPAASGLAGIIEQDNQRLETNPTPTTTEEAEVNFKKKETTVAPPVLNEQEQAFLNLFKELEKQFTEDELGLVMEVLDAFAKDKTSLQEVLDFLQDVSEEEPEV